MTQLADQLGAMTAADTARAVRSGALSAAAATSAALERIAARNGQLNAFTVILAEEAISQAEALDAGGPGHDGPLAGVPVAVKEEYAVAGLVTTLGGRGNSTPASADSEVVRRLRAAGAIIVGKTTQPEFGQFPFTESAVSGITRNPWDVQRSPGGSSGGSAVAVAAGMVPLAMGSDGGGSIRIPASACGLVGLKPTRGRISLAPLAQHWYSLVGLGGLTRTVADTALLLDVVAGGTTGDRWQAAPSPRPYAEAVADWPGPLRIVWSVKPVVPGRSTDPQVSAATAAIAGHLAGLGHAVTEIRPRWPVPTDAFLPQFYAGMREEAETVEHPDRLEPRTRQTVRWSTWATPRLAEWAVSRGERAAAALDARVFERADVLLIPVMPVLPAPLRFLDGMHTLRAQLATMPYVANTVITNVTGHPSLAIPAGTSAEGWPIGVQLIGRRGAEDQLLGLAGALEAARPWPGIAPEYRVGAGDPGA